MLVEMPIQAGTMLFAPALPRDTRLTLATLEIV